MRIAPSITEDTSGMRRPPGSNKLYEPERVCSCGLTIPRCPFWFRAVERLRRYEHATVPERYTVVLEVFTEVFGQGQTLVDSSKSLSSLQTVDRVPGVMLRVIHLLRDVRSWIVSRRDHDIRTDTATFRDLREKFGHRAWGLYFRQSPLARSLIWYHGNVRIQKFLSKHKIPVFTLGYEELALETAAVIDRLRLFLEGDLSDGMKDISGSNSHIVLGNRMRLDRTRRSQVSYDHRWFRRREWEAPALLLPHVMRFNRRWVYGNVQRHS